MLRFSPEGLVTQVTQQGGVASLDVWEEGDWRDPEEEGLGARGRGRTSLRLSMPLGSSVHSIDVECPVDVESIIGSSRLVQWWSPLAFALSSAATAQGHSIRFGLNLWEVVLKCI